MEALTGRDLDAAVARALGWHDFITSDAATYDVLGPYYAVPPGAEITETSGYTWIPYYSVNIFSAWEIIETLRSAGWLMNLSVNEYMTEPWDCRFFHERDIRVIAHGGTAQIAISRAALAALGVPPGAATPGGEDT